MKSLLAPSRCIGETDRVDPAVELLEDAWRRGKADLKRFWMEQKRFIAGQEDDPVTLLSELIKTDLRCRYARGESPSITEYLESFSELRGSDDRILSLIYEQFCLGEERGDKIDVESFCERYPQWKDSLLSQLQYHRLFSKAAGLRPEPPPFPKPGDTFEEFQLLSLLGEGGTSRVFLARDLSLGGKQVVLKVSLDRGQEPKAQGALDHPHIVPVNSVVFGDRQMRGLSMPFRPGLPLDTLIKRIKPESRPRGAMSLWRTLLEGTEIPDRAESTERTGVLRPAVVGRGTGPQGDGWDGFPLRGSYPQGVAWIVMTLAQALDHAHCMRTFHRDVKPGNVLLTLSHGPQLLDFNLAESPHSVTQAEAAMHGGTLPYMAPEQIEAFLDPKLWGKVGAKADIYSLGLVLRELLTGQQPDLPAETISPQRAMRLLLDRRPRLDLAVSRYNPSIPRALEAIVAKCLAFSPDDRYSDARALADDLRRFLTHRPLVHALNPSRRERIKNWAFRNRRAIAGVAAVILVANVLATPVRRGFENRFVPIETSRSFQSAVRTLEDAESLKPGRSTDDLVEPFDELMKTYPESWQPKVYLSFVRDLNNPCSQEAERLFREALSLPGVHNDLIAWGKTHPKFVGQLERFASRRFDHADSFFKDRPEASLEERRPIQREHVRLANEALQIAVELQPDSSSIVKLLALSELVMGEYTSAYERIIKEIDDIYSQADKDHWNPNDIESELLEPWYIQCQIAIEWADQIRAGETVGAAKEAHDLLRKVEKRAKFCAAYVHLHKSPMNRDYQFCIENQLLVELGLMETGVDLGALQEAEKSLTRIKYYLLPEYTSYLESVAGKLESVEVRRLVARLNDAANRLHLQEAVGAIGGMALMQVLEPTASRSISTCDNGLGEGPSGP